jgi:hypothetical protein
MARKGATLKSTGGEGFEFADRVAAGFLVEILSMGFPLGTDHGHVVRLDWEVKESRWHLDDLLLRLRTREQEGFCAISVKSNDQLNSNGFSASFAADAWEQWRQSPENPFERGRDFLGLAVSRLASGVEKAWRAIERRRTPADRLADTLTTPHQSNYLQRNIFTSLERASAASGSNVSSPAEVAELLSRICVFVWDSAAEERAVHSCREMTVQKSTEDGLRLWKRLIGLATEGRVAGGSMSVESLIRTLRSDFDLREYPDYEASWESVDRVSQANRDLVRDKIGLDVRFDLAEQEEILRQRLSEGKVVAVLAESGTGKSALVSRFLRSQKAPQRYLWLRPSQLSKSSQQELAQQLGLRHDLPTLIRNSARASGLLVLDGFEQFEGDGLDRAFELVRALSAEAVGDWRVLITCQTLRWQDRQRRLVDAGVSSVWEMAFSGPTFDQIWVALKGTPRMLSVLSRSELRDVLLNLATLDQVIKTHMTQPFSSTRPWVGETEVIDWVWAHWRGSDAKRLARAEVLRTLGELDGVRVSGAVRLEDVPHDRLELLGELCDANVLRADEDLVQFAHDIMADWARYQVLKSSGSEAPKKIRVVAAVPRWDRAIRLYAQSLAEQGDGLDKWNSVFETFGERDTDSTIASDCFIDSLILATNSPTLLEQLWPNLLSDNAKILRRMLKRIQIVATMPHPNIEQIADAELRREAYKYLRIPIPIHWIGFLRALRSHSDDVARLAWAGAAKACGLYLRTVPRGFVGREEAARLALSLAREVQGLLAEDTYLLDNVDRPVYEALFYSALDFPEEAGIIALELCHRRAEPEHAVTRRIAAYEEQKRQREEYEAKHPEKAKRRSTGFFASSRGPARPPWPDGPSERVNGAFISAVMDTPAFEALIMARPQIAQEVLLAVCIEEPTESRDYSISRMLDEGLANWEDGYPAMYFKGPFLRFLERSPEEGLQTILRLVNFATDRWLENRIGPQPKPEDLRRFSFEFLIDGQETLWHGDATVFHWHRFAPHEGSAVGCAQMALEKWLYDSIEAKRDVSRAIRTILSNATSVAFAGVLIAVGMRFPTLFCTLLQSMLSSPWVFFAQLNGAIQEGSNLSPLAMMSWSNQGNDTIQKVIDWNKMEHRRYHLQDVAQWLLVQDPATMTFLGTCSARWKEIWAEDIADPGINTEQLEFLIAKFDPANYERVNLGDGSAGMKLNLPENLQQRTVDKAEEQTVNAIVLTLLSRARDILNRNSNSQAWSAPELFAALRRIDETEVNSEPVKLYRARALAGGAAALFSRERTWLRANPDAEAWCLGVLARGAGAPDPEPFTAPQSAGDTWEEAFRGEAGLVLLCEREDEWIRRAVFDGVTGYFYESTGVIMKAAYEKKEKLGPRFEELVNLVILWAAVRNGANYEVREGPEDVLKPYKNALFRRYQSGRLSGQSIPLERAQLLGRRLADRASRRGPYPRVRQARRNRSESPRSDGKRDRTVYKPPIDLDLSVLRKGFSFLGEVGTVSGDETIRLSGYFRRLFDFEIRSLPVVKDRRDWELDHYDREYESWIMEFAAVFVAKAETNEMARSLYGPILDLSAHGRYRVQDFLHAWFRYGLALSGSETTFVARWREIVQYALSSAEWGRAKCGLWFYLDQLACELVGITGNPTLRVAGEQFRNAICEMAPTFERWCDVWLESPSVVAHFSYFLSTPAGGVLLPYGVVKVAAAVKTFSDSDWNERDLKFALSKALIACWERRADEVRIGGEVGQAFHDLLNQLCSMLVDEALHLRTRVAES